MARRKQAEFFIATQIELFLVIIFVVFLRAGFAEKERDIIIGDLEDAKVMINKLLDDLKRAEARIDSLVDVTRWAQQEADSLDGVIRELTGTGPGNCLELGLLAAVRCSPKGEFEVEIMVDEEIPIYEEWIIESREIYHFTESEFIAFGQELLDYSSNQTPECRFCVRFCDSPDLTKDDYKRYFRLVRRYFFTEPEP